jgi:uncharacterized protein (TIGR02466 family)
MMLREFKITNPFARSTEMFTGQLDLNHEEIAKFMRQHLHGGASDKYTSYFDQRQNSRMNKDMPCRRQMINAMIACCDTYAKVRNMDTERLHDHGEPDCWFSEYVDGDRHTLHNHPRALLAGTYYPYADEDSCDIRFRHPACGQLSMVEPWNTESADFDFVIHRLQPKTGMINIWPSWMEHEIGPQKKVPKERSRLAISFNYGRAR